jgi:curved DNA-binding protein CbpA
MGLMKDYYKILEIQPDASLEVMNNAYRALVRKYHPDLYHVKQKTLMNAKMQEINEAYKTLSTPTSRAEYDRRYKQPVQETPPVRKVDWKPLLLWALGTFILVRYLVKPLLFSPIGKLLLIGAIFILIFKVLLPKKKP